MITGLEGDPPILSAAPEKDQPAVRPSPVSRGIALCYFLTYVSHEDAWD